MLRRRIEDGRSVLKGIDEDEDGRRQVFLKASF